MLAIKFRFIWLSSFREYFWKSTTQKQDLSMAAMFVSGDCGEIIDLNRGSAIDAACQVSVPLARQFQRRLLEIDESETRIACGGHVLNGSGRNTRYL